MKVSIQSKGLCEDYPFQTNSTHCHLKHFPITAKPYPEQSENKVKCLIKDKMYSKQIFFLSIIFKANLDKCLNLLHSDVMSRLALIKFETFSGTPAIKENNLRPFLEGMCETIHEQNI